MEFVCTFTALVATAAQKGTNGTRFKVENIFSVHVCHLICATLTKYMRALKAAIERFSYIATSLKIEMNR